MPLARPGVSTPPTSLCVAYTDRSQEALNAYSRSCPRADLYHGASKNSRPVTTPAPHGE